MNFLEKLPAWIPWAGLGTVRSLINCSWMAFPLATLSFHYDKEYICILEINLLMLIWEEDSVNRGKYDLDSKTWNKGTILVHFGSLIIDWHLPVVSESRVVWKLGKSLKRRRQENVTKKPYLCLQLLFLQKDLK